MFFPSPLPVSLQQRKPQHKMLGDTRAELRNSEIFICCTTQLLPRASLWSPEAFYQLRGVRIIDFSTQWLNQNTGGKGGGEGIVSSLFEAESFSFDSAQ